MPKAANINGELAVKADHAANLFGEFFFKVDAKGRLSLPSKFRKVLPKDLVVSLELTDECLYVYHPDEFNAWIDTLFEDRFGGYNASDKTHVRLRSRLKSRADGVEVDSSGRIMLNPKMREAAGIDKDVVLVGNTGYFEVWDKDAYESRIANMDLGMFYTDSGDMDVNDMYSSDTHAANAGYEDYADEAESVQIVRTITG